MKINRTLWKIDKHIYKGVTFLLIKLIKINKINVSKTWSKVTIYEMDVNIGRVPNATQIAHNKSDGTLGSFEPSLSYPCAFTFFKIDTIYFQA